MLFRNNFITLIGTFSLLIWIGMNSCKSKNAESSGDTKTPLYETEEFKTFYDRFGKDSVFQMEHIVFPLEGMPSIKDSTDVIPPDFKWTPDSWVIHKTYNDMDGTFSREMIDMSGVVIERISDAETGNYSMERRFGKLDSGWHLIYYRELGPF